MEERLESKTPGPMQWQVQNPTPMMFFDTGFRRVKPEQVQRKRKKFYEDERVDSEGAHYDINQDLLTGKYPSFFFVMGNDGKLKYTFPKFNPEYKDFDGFNLNEQELWLAELIHYHYMHDVRKKQKHLFNPLNLTDKDLSKSVWRIVAICIQRDFVELWNSDIYQNLKLL